MSDTDPIVACFEHHDPTTECYHEIEVFASDLSAPYAHLVRDRRELKQLLSAILLEAADEPTRARASAALEILAGVPE